MYEANRELVYFRQVPPVQTSLPAVCRIPKCLFNSLDTGLLCCQQLTWQEQAAFCDQCVSEERVLERAVDTPGGAGVRVWLLTEGSLTDVEAAVSSKEQLVILEWCFFLLSS